MKCSAMSRANAANTHYGRRWRCAGQNTAAKTDMCFLKTKKEP